jgi:hypothetical protein
MFGKSGHFASEEEEPPTLLNVRGQNLFPQHFWQKCKKKQIFFVHGSKQKMSSLTMV